MEGLNLKITKDNVHFTKGMDIANKFDTKDKSKLAKASKEFESILTSMMIKSMTKTTDGLFGKDNYGGDVLDVLFETEISNFITNKQGMGVAEQIYRNITGEELPKSISFDKEKRASIKFENLPSISAEKKAEINSKINSKAFERIQNYKDYIDQASDKFNIEPNLIKSVILTESAGKVNAESKAKAKGLMQLMDSTATDMGVRNPWNPKENIFGGTKYLSKMLKEFDGDRDLALAAYNAGPGNVKKYGGIPPFKETQAYIKRVNNYLNILD